MDLFFLFCGMTEIRICLTFLVYFRSSLNIRVLGIAHVLNEGQLIFVHFVEARRGDTSPGPVGEMFAMNPSSSNRRILGFVLTRSTDHYYLVFCRSSSSLNYFMHNFDM